MLDALVQVQDSTLKAPLSWDEYFILIALFTSLRSKDPRSKVGAVIVDDQKHIIGTGYNGFVRGTDETLFSWAHSGEWLSTKYPYVIHAEQNAILNATRRDLERCTVYSTLFPCNECVKMLAQKGIKDIFYISDKNRAQKERIAAERIIKAADIKTRQLQVPAFVDLAQRVLDDILGDCG